MDEHYILDQYHPESQVCIATVQELSVVPYKGNILIDRPRKTSQYEKATVPHHSNTLPLNQSPPKNAVPQTDREYDDNTPGQYAYGVEKNHYYLNEKYNSLIEPLCDVNHSYDSSVNRSYVLPAQYSNPEQSSEYRRIKSKVDKLRRTSLDMTPGANLEIRKTPSPRYFPNRNFETHYNMTNKYRQSVKPRPVKFNRDQDQQDKRHTQNVESDDEDLVSTEKIQPENLTKPNLKLEFSKELRNSSKTKETGGKERTINSTYYEDIEQENNRIAECVSNPGSEVQNFERHYHITNKPRPRIKHWPMKFIRSQDHQNKMHTQNIDKQPENLTKSNVKVESSRVSSVRDSSKTEETRRKESTINPTCNEDIEEEKNRIEEYLSSPDSQNVVQLPCRIEERIRQWLQKKKKNLELKTILKVRPEYSTSHESQTSVTTLAGKQYEKQRASLEARSKGTYAKILTTMRSASDTFDHQRAISGDLMRLMIRKAEQRKRAKARLMDRKQRFPLRSPYITFTEKFRLLQNTSTVTSLKTGRSILKKGNTSTQLLSLVNSKTKTVADCSSRTSIDVSPTASVRSKATIKSKASDVETVFQKFRQYRRAKRDAERLEKEIYKAIK